MNITTSVNMNTEEMLNVLDISSKLSSKDFLKNIGNLPNHAGLGPTASIKLEDELLDIMSNSKTVSVTELSHKYNVSPNKMYKYLMAIKKVI